jgi:hypothetical protein
LRGKKKHGAVMLFASLSLPRMNRTLTVHICVDLQVVEIPPVALHKFIAIALAEQYNFAALLADGSPQFWRDFENIFNRSACTMPTARSRRLETNTAR